jgi:cellulose synthase/poly-beta-1,6-N-acetylglucosamine synthase-like glycosyltransferase
MQSIRPAQYSNGKAAALNEIIKRIDSDLVCVFDADSKPEKDFLLKCTGYFENTEVALVQGRNAQLNATDTLVSLLTTFDIYSMQFSIYYPITKFGFGIFEGRGAIFRRKVLLNWAGSTKSYQAKTSILVIG